MQISKNLLKWSRVFDIFKSPTNTLKIIKRKFIHKLYKKQQQKNISKYVASNNIIKRRRIYCWINFSKTIKKRKNRIPNKMVRLSYDLGNMGTIIEFKIC